MISWDTGIAHLASAYGRRPWPVRPRRPRPVGPARRRTARRARPPRRPARSAVRRRAGPALLAIGVEEVLAAAAAAALAGAGTAARPRAEGRRAHPAPCPRPARRRTPPAAAPEHTVTPARHPRRPGNLCDSRHRTPPRRPQQPTVGLGRVHGRRSTTASVRRPSRGTARRRPRHPTSAPAVSRGGRPARGAAFAQRSGRSASRTAPGRRPRRDDPSTPSSAASADPLRQGRGGPLRRRPTHRSSPARAGSR